MPVLRQIREAFAESRPFEGIRIVGCAHITTETANLALTLQAGGADAVLCASNPLSTQDDVAAALVEAGIPVFAIKGEDGETYHRHIHQAISHKPHIVIDDGADVVTILHKEYADLLPASSAAPRRPRPASFASGRWRPKASSSSRSSPSTTPTPSTSSTTATAPARAPSTASCAPPTSCWRAGLSSSPDTAGAARGSPPGSAGMGAQVIVTEVDPVRALEAAMDGFMVMTMEEAAPLADLVVTATGNINVVDRHHFEAMKDGAIMANSGHFNSEINLKALEEMSGEGSPHAAPVRRGVHVRRQEPDRARRGPPDQPRRRRGSPGQRDGHELRQPGARRRVHRARRGQRSRTASTACREEIDHEIAALKLQAMGIAIDELTAEQDKYLHSWEG